MPFDTSWPVAIAMLAFIAVSVVVGAAMGGAATAGDERPRFSSMRTSGGRMGTAAYESCVTFRVGRRDIAVELRAPLRLFHPPFHLHWDAMEHCRVVDMPGGTLTHL